MRKRESIKLRLMRLARAGKPMPEYIPAIVAARVLYLSRVQVLRYFASGDLRGSTWDWEGMPRSKSRAQAQSSSGRRTKDERSLKRRSINGWRNSKTLDEGANSRKRRARSGRNPRYLGDGLRLSFSFHSRWSFSRASQELARCHDRYSAKWMEREQVIIPTYDTRSATAHCQLQELVVFRVMALAYCFGDLHQNRISHQRSDEFDPLLFKYVFVKTLAPQNPR